MPELPDIELYIHALRQRILGTTLERIRLASPFLLRSVDPSLDATFGRSVAEISRLGKRIVLGLEGEHFLILHLMIAGRLRWKGRQAVIPKKVGLAAFDFTEGTMILTEAGAKKRASLHVACGKDTLSEHDRGGLNVLQCSLQDFVNRLKATRHTVKRALCDPVLFSGIGNAYSDEILHAGRLSPFKLSGNLTADELSRLFEATRSTLREWTERLVQQSGDRFPDKVTAFRPEMAVHGKYGQPCPACSTAVQRIVYATNETNYCPSCQTEGRLLKDRALSRLLRSDWPRTPEELEQRQT
ncbi:MAG: DNA-formamidopyrimidine glycosylase family protein [Gemmatimonadales bacterium]